MVGFFRLGKIDRGAKDGEGRSDSPGLEAGSGGASSSGAGVATMPAAVAQDPLKDKPEKKKKSKDEPGPAPSAALGAGDSRAAAGPARAQAGLSVNDFISKTKNQQRQGLKPSGPELIAYARYLGIDPVADHDLLWIAVEALEAPLPSDWTEHFDSNDRVFYYNATTRVSSWTHPLEHTYRETYKTIVTFRNSNWAPQERSENLQKLQHEVKQLESDVHKEIAQWSEHTDEQGNRFYFNREERQSTWTDPRPAKCQILYLRMKMLRLLQSGAGATPGFADSKGGGLSGFGPYPHADDDPAQKRSKIGGDPKGADPFMKGLDKNARASPEGGRSGADSDQGSDSDSGDERKAKKSKKKKKKKKQKGDAEHAVKLGAPQKLGNSHSEPNVGSSPRTAASSSAAGGVGGAGANGAGAGSQHPALGGLAPLDESGLSSQGRARVKAGIRLEPIGPGGEADPGSHAKSAPSLKPA